MWRASACASARPCLIGLPTSIASIRARYSMRPRTRSASLMSRRPRSAAVSRPHSPSSARSEESTAASISAPCPRAIAPISIPREGSSTGRNAPDRAATQRPSMRHLSVSNQASFDVIILRAALDPTPDFLDDFDEARELDPLVGLGEVVAVRGRGEAALVAQRALVERDILGRLHDAALDLVLRLRGGALRAHEAEHDCRALRREAQRREIARTLVVVFEEEAVDLHLVEQNFGDRLVAALRDPGALEVAAAEMDADRHVGWPVADRIVDQPAIEPCQRVRVVAARLGAGADVGVAKIGKIGVVELQIAASARGEIGDLGAIGGGEVAEEILEVRIDRLADRLAPAAEMQHRGRRDADFWRAGGRRLQKIEIRALDRRDPPDLAADMHRRRLEPDLRAIVLAERGDEFTVVGFDALEALEEIDVEIGAAEFTVGDPLQTHVLLRAHDLANAFVLDCVHVRRRKPTSGEPLARFPKALGAKITADVIGAKRRTRHEAPPFERSDSETAWSHAV